MSMYQKFEEQFAATGLSDRYNALLAKCTPKPVQMTNQQEQESRRIAKEQTSTKNAARMAVKDVIGIATTELQQEAISMKRKAMIEDDVFDEYTRATNKIDDAARV